MTPSMRASITGFSMPMTLRLPGTSAVAEDHQSRCSLPGDSDWGNDCTDMSKSNPSILFWYWAVSTVLTRASMPSRSRFRANGSTTRSNAGLTSRISNAIVFPVAAFVNLPSRTVQPAFSRSRRAFRRFARALPEPSVVGGS